MGGGNWENETDFALSMIAISKFIQIHKQNQVHNSILQYTCAYYIFTRSPIFILWIFSITGYFYAPDNKDESVLGLCTDLSNDALYSGDTTGNIKVWDISGYCRHAEERVRSRNKHPQSYLKQKLIYIVSLNSRNNTVH